MQYDIPQVTIRFTPDDHMTAFARLKHEASYQLQQAHTTDERRYWQHQIDRADNALLRWKAQAERGER